MSKTHPKLFEPFIFAKGMTLRNRVVMAPMTTWAGNPDGTVSDEEVGYYRRRVNGVGLVITGCSHVLPNGIGFTDEFASYDDRFGPSLKRLAEAAKSGGAPALLQIFHAGNKAVSELVPGGEVVSASAITTEAGPFSPSVTPRALTHGEILDVIRAFGEATRRAIEAGFDGIELHGAHGFLIQNFLSPRFNQRTDEWGGSLENRMRFPLAVLREVKRVIESSAKRPFLLGYRISPEEPDEGGLRIDETLLLVESLVNCGVDYIHASLASVLEAKPIGGTGEKTTAKLVLERVGGRVPVIAAGQIRKPDQAANAMELGLSLVAVGQGLVVNPDWVELAKSDLDERIDTALSPSKVPSIAIPGKLWAVIEATTGWFKLQAKPRRTTAQAELSPSA
ncbi:NADH:flavin oxidoreductase [Phyllobacterium brassicacearum]|uniref:NADH:flavin oxidoreductase n=1 Tax=Phyllobacterium brassicacearum TaxID=314235 RepID=A0A2P7B912_9HYPH|nr:NADH-dependent flavin oxidoreductase [Phyllobacterium brassicacearum]PSH62960.1 NADH:flavin oxidoreductase [Phyllobacterium brassicacearum]TDQ09168.1 2,4-dienoyl-CoA reductase-like NADH-dependent reductase (Old Yellow Enzyme family) [Phyllobacterium brassicacearum]